MGFMSGLFTFIAYLIYALGDLILAEIIGIVIEKKTSFKKTEWFVFLTIGVGISIFFLSNSSQGFLINQLIKLGWWLSLIFLIMFLLNILILARLTKGRRWRFRLVLIPLLLLGVIFVAALIFILSGPEHTEQILANTSEILQ